MRKRRILITGGSGFVGGYLVNFARSDFEVHATCHRNIFNIPSVQFHQIDLTLPGAAEIIFQKCDPEIIIHTAAISDPDFCETNRDIARAINFDFSVRLFDLAREQGRRFIFTSTDLIFDGTGRNYRESSSPNPINFYARTKVDVENYMQKFPSNAVVARLALVYGLGLTRKDTFFEKTVKKLKAGEPIILFEDQFRSPIWVNDLAEALLELARNDFTGKIHLCGDECLSRLAFGHLMCDAFGFSRELIEPKSMKEFPTKAARPEIVCLKSECAHEILKTKIHKPKEALRLICESMN